MTSRAHSFTSAFRHVVLLAAILVGLVALDRFGAAALRFAYTNSTASPETLLSQVRPDTVVIGTSTAKYSFRPDAWDGKLLNLAQDGQTVVFSIVYAAILPPIEGLRRLIVVIDATDLRLGMKNRHISRVWRLAPSIAAHPEVASILKPPLASWEPLAWSHLYHYRGAVEDIVKGLFRPNTVSYQALQPGRVEEPRANPSPDSKAKFRDLDPSLDDMIALLKSTTTRLGVTLVLVSPLEYKRPPNARDRYVFSELVARLQGIPVCNLLGIETPELRRIRDKANYFHDEVHLDGRGATAYTREMDRVIKERCGRSQSAGTVAR